MNLRYSFNVAGLQPALLVLLASAALQFACYARWPGSPMYDVGYSIFAAQNFVAHGQLKSLNVLADYHDDLAQFAQPRWMVHFPPGHSVLYAAVMSFGLSPGAATKALGLAGILLGGFGWICLARFLGACKSSTTVLATAYPWLPFIGTVYQLYETEQVAIAIMPWFCLSLLRIDSIASTPLSKPLAAAQWPNLVIAIFLALLLVIVKYSLVPVFLGAALYLILQDGARFGARSIWWKAAVAGLLIFPGLLFLLVNSAYGPRVQVDDAHHPYFVFQFARNILNTTISGTLGWQTVVPRLFNFARLPVLPGLIDILSLASVVVWILHFRRFPLPERTRAFGLLLIVSTIALWLSLGVSTYLGKQEWDFSADGRLYMPITLLWLLCCVASLGQMRARDVIRSPAFYALALPMLLSALFEIRGGALLPPSPAMPQSGLAWTLSHDPEHATFLSRFALSRKDKPDLLLAMPSVMNELTVPNIYNGFAVPPGHRYWSSRKLEVWALFAPSQEKVVLAEFSAASMQRIVTPPHFPFVFFIFKFAPDRVIHGVRST
ncbi:MAG: hypothetical protein ISS15_02795 [Alphaproteobacteria bacterium]|nr:hypothetical protein [Alphaproteobacteria bacterium]MBL7096562.1 hypothetical protein [Alphaproteobacteria bacterium]